MFETLTQLLSDPNISNDVKTEITALWSIVIFLIAIIVVAAVVGWCHMSQARRRRNNIGQNVIESISEGFKVARDNFRF